MIYLFQDVYNKSRNLKQALRMICDKHLSSPLLKFRRAVKLHCKYLSTETGSSSG